MREKGEKKNLVLIKDTLIALAGKAEDRHDND